MFPKSQANFAPDGSSHAGLTRQRELHPSGAEAMRAARQQELPRAGACETAYHNDEGFDEGLVHAHRWALTH